VLDSHPDVGIVYGDRQDFGWYHKTQHVPEFDLFSLLKRNFIDACAVFRKQVWFDCEGYETDISVVADWELWINAAKLGWKFHHLPRVCFDYRMRPGSMVMGVDSIEVLEDFCRRIRSKHPDFYWNVAVGGIEALKAELKSISLALTEKDNQVRQLESELKTRNSEIVRKDSELQALLEKVQAISALLAEREAELSRIRRSLGWRLLGRYGQIKYRYLLPIYRLLGRAP